MAYGVTVTVMLLSCLPLFVGLQLPATPWPYVSDGTQSGWAAAAAAEQCLSPPQAVTLLCGWDTGATRRRSVDTRHSSVHC